MLNPGNYKHRIGIFEVIEDEDTEGFRERSKNIVLRTWASVKTTKGFTLITSGTDFEKAYTNFTIRYPNKQITRDMLIEYNGKTYSIEYLNNVNEEGIELEIQAKEVTK